MAGIRQLVNEKAIQPGETVVAILTGHLLKDTDYVVNYHKDSLYLRDERHESAKGSRIVGTFANHPVRVEASREVIKGAIENLQQRHH